MRLVLVSALVVLAAVPAAQEPGPVSRDERAALGRLLDRAVRGQRPRDRGTRWDVHFLKGAEGGTYVPFTLTLDEAGDRFASAAVAVRVAVRELSNARFGGFVYRFIQQNAFGAGLPPAAAGARVLRSALMLRPGRYEVFIVVRDRDGRGDDVLFTQSLSVPDFRKKGLLLSSVIVVGRLEPIADGGVTASAVRPYAFGSFELVPRDGTTFARDEALTVAFQVYNAATFVDGKPDVQVDYRVHRAGQERAVGATAPQTFDVDSLPEEFSAAAGHQLTPVQSLPLKQFEPGEYRLEIEVRDYLADARATAEVPFTVEEGKKAAPRASKAHAFTDPVPRHPSCRSRRCPGP